MYVKSFGKVMLKGSEILAIHTPFCTYNYNIKKKSQDKITVNFILFLKNIIKLSIHWMMGTSADLIISTFFVSIISG